jgi:hypothetical protein
VTQDAAWQAVVARNGVDLRREIPPLADIPLEEVNWWLYQLRPSAAEAEIEDDDDDGDAADVGAGSSGRKKKNKGKARVGWNLKNADKEEDGDQEGWEGDTDEEETETRKRTRRRSFLKRAYSLGSDMHALQTSEPATSKQE